ncbi:MAG: helix-turn-helix transcriptional regulator [Candidatus Gastranaerophilales bacterium]|nr:helix-turn-helix transcriptional regulator [Candidatus Gastranaerophilales bacterium]
MSELRALLGRNIKRLRKFRKWTQAELAEKINVEPVSIARIETGINFPKEENLIAIAKILNVEVADLFNTSEEEKMSVKSALNYIHYSIHTLEERDLKILCSMIKTMSSC